MTGLDISACHGRTRYTAKDALKAMQSTKFIGRGSARSSTDAYRRAIGPRLANTGEYRSDDIVWISVEGARSGRLEHDHREISIAATASVTFITDGAVDRNRPYNIGERQVAILLGSLEYREVSPGRWMKMTARVSPTP